MGIRMRNKESGFTLVEVMTATVIIAVLAGGIFSTTSFTKRMEVTSGQRIVAMSKVSEYINELKRLGPSQLLYSQPNSPTSPSACVADPTQCNLCVSITPYCRDFHELNNTVHVFVSAIVSDTNPADPKAKEVVVRADWIDSLGLQRTESAAMYIQG